MSDYCYLVFPHGKQPTVDEAGELKNLSGKLRGKLAMGYDRKSGGLALAFDRSVFEQTLTTHRGFRQLVEKWKVRGAQLAERLAFVKDKSALQPRPESSWNPDGPSVSHGSREEKRLATKQLAAQEAIGQSLLSMHRTLDRYAALQRITGVLPYLLILLAMGATCIAGAVVYQRLSNSDLPPRRELIAEELQTPPAPSFADKLSAGN